MIGCATHVRVISGDKDVILLGKNKAYIAPQDGYFVPKARMQDILNRLAEKEVFGTNAPTK